VLIFALSLALAGPALPDPTLTPTGMQVNNAPVEPKAPVTSTTLGRLHVDVLLPAEILFDGVKLGQLWIPGKTTFELPTGPHLLRVYTQGNPQDLRITLAADMDLRVVVGRNGVTAEQLARTDDKAAIVPVDFRVLGTRGASIRMNGTQHAIEPGGQLALELADGSHSLSVRSSDGTVIWATGQLTVHGGAPVVVQIAEGRMPEVSGAGSFNPGAGG
jgi:hypothetical protein